MAAQWYYSHDGKTKGGPVSAAELKALARSAVLTRDALLTSVWGEDFFGDPRTVDVHIRWLRGKIEEDPSSPRYIQTVRGVGYKFAVDGS